VEWMDGCEKSRGIGGWNEDVGMDDENGGMDDGWMERVCVQPKTLKICLQVVILGVFIPPQHTWKSHKGVKRDFRPSARKHGRVFLHLPVFSCNFSAFCKFLHLQKNTGTA